MFALTLALALDSSSVDTIKIQEPSKAVRAQRELTMPNRHEIVLKVARSENAPENLTTCYSNRFGSCWSEN